MMRWTARPGHGPGTRKSAARSPRLITRLGICWVVHDPSGVGGHAEDVHVAGADLHDEQAVQALEGDGAVDVEQVGGEHRRSVREQELPPCRVGVPLGCRPARWSTQSVQMGTPPLVERSRATISAQSPGAGRSASASASASIFASRPAELHQLTEGTRTRGVSTTATAGDQII